MAFEELVRELTLAGRSPEYISSLILAQIERDEEYPCYTEAELARKGRRERTSEEVALENIPDGQALKETKGAIDYLAQNAKLRPLDVTILSLRVDGYTLAEIADTMRMDERTVRRRLVTVRRRIEETTTPEWWRSLHEVTIYHKPSLCCSPGLEKCRGDGHCPYGRTRIAP